MASKLFDPNDWPRDPRLDPFRDAVWELSLHGQPLAHMTTHIIPMRAFPTKWARKQEWLWYQVNWLDGRRDRPDEDYGPEWFVVQELEGGTFEYPHGGREVSFDAKPVTGVERADLWARYGPPDFGKTSP